MMIFALFIPTAFLSYSQAAPFCPPIKSQIAGPAEVINYLFKTAIIGNADRRTLKDFAKESGESEAEIANRYAASGYIVCDDYMAQASVVMKSDLIVVSAHVLYEGDDCNKAKDPKKCKAQFIEKGKRVTYEVLKQEAEGYVCPDSSSMKPRNDWAILRLKKPVSSSIKPYSIKTAPCSTSESPTDVVLVGQSKDFKRDPTKPMTEAPRHYGRCRIYKGNCPGATFPTMVSDCDLDGGSSGGGLFTGGNEPQMIGIAVGHRDTCPESAKDKTGQYREMCWSSVSVPIAGELKDRLERLASE